MAFCRLVSLALAAVAHTSASQYHGRVTLEEVKAYDHAGARSGRSVPKGQYNVHANPHKKAKAEAQGAYNKPVQVAVAYDFKDNTVTDVDCVVGEWGEYNHCASPREFSLSIRANERL